MKKLLSSEAFKYLLFGVLTTLVYMGTHLVTFVLAQSAMTSAVIVNVIAIVLAFSTSDYFVFNQVRIGWFSHFVRFFVTRLSTPALDLILAYLLVMELPHIIR